VGARVFLEQGRSSVIAVAIDWPGWLRRARTGDRALELLEEYVPRYAEALGWRFRPGPLEVVASVPGTTGTDFGTPSAVGPWDDEPLAGRALATRVAAIESLWAFFDRVIAGAPASLRKGPRGGGRDRDAIGDHVREAERAYASRLGARVAPRTPWPEQRATIAAALRAGSADGRWPLGFSLRKVGYHVADHAWEVQDRSA
jgi:hypothetical protein